MSIDSPQVQPVLDERSGIGSKILAAVCALAVTAILLGGYAVLRKRHAEQNLAASAKVASEKEVAANVPKGPPKIHVLIDDPMLKGGETLIGGTVKNISNEGFANVFVELELRRRKDGGVEQLSVPTEPAQLGPGGEGRYEVKFPAQQYGSVRLIGIRPAESDLLAYTTGQGIKRPFEKTASKTIVIGKASGSRNDEFLNTPDNPQRVP
jgi:hypothetical protein